MENGAIEHFHHRQGGKPSVVSAAPADTLREVLIRLGPLEEGIFVFVGECDYALKGPLPTLKTARMNMSLSTSI